MGIRFTPDRLDPTFFTAAPRPGPERPPDEPQAQAPPDPLAPPEPDELEEAREAREAEEAEDERDRLEPNTLAPQRRTQALTTAGPDLNALPGANLDLFA